MESRQVLVVDAFADEPTGGVPVGVVPDAAALSDDQLRAVAGELGRGATAFAVPATETEAAFRLRFVGPDGERDAPAHATLAACADRFGGQTGTHDVETPAGTLAVDVDDDLVWVDQPRTAGESVDLDHATVADALGIDVAALRDIGADAPLERATAGRSVLLVPVNYFERLSGADPDPGAVADICEQADVEGLYAFTFDTIGAEATAHARAFPADDVPMGDGAVALGGYLRRHAVLDGERDAVVVERGHFRNRPGRVHVRTDGHEASVGGPTVTSVAGEVTVPDTDEDDIIEA